MTETFMRREILEIPEAAARLTAARTELTAISESVQVPVENLISPELVRRLCWDWDPVPGADVTEYIAMRFADGGARPWQREVVAPRLATVLTT